MFLVKRYTIMSTAAALVLCTSGLFSMKKTKTVTEIKDHKIVQACDGIGSDIIHPDSIKVFDVQFLKPKSNSLPHLSLFLDTKTIALVKNEFGPHKKRTYYSKIEIWDWEQGSCMYTFENNEYNRICCLEKLTDSTIIFGDDREQIIMWNFINNSVKKIGTSTGKKIKIKQIIKLTDSIVIAIKNKEVIEIWDIQKGMCLISQKFASDFGSLIDNVIHISEKKIFISTTKGLKIMTFDQKKNICTFQDIFPIKKSFSFSTLSPQKGETYLLGGSTIFKGTTNNNIFILETKTNKRKVVIEIQNTPHFLLNFPDDNAILCIDDEFIQLLSLDIPSKKVVTNFCGTLSPFLKFEDEDYFDPFYIDIRGSETLIAPFLFSQRDKKSPNISVTYFEEENTIMIVTKAGFIITLFCKGKQHSKDLTYLFQHLKICKNKKNFKDCLFKFK